MDLFDLSNLWHLLELKVHIIYVCSLRTVGLFEHHAGMCQVGGRPQILADGSGGALRKVVIEGMAYQTRQALNYNLP